MSPTTKKSLLALTFLVAASVAAGAATVACSVESGGPTLNPQPLPPANPPEGPEGEENRDPDSLGSGVDDDGSGGSPTSPDAGRDGE